MQLEGEAPKRRGRPPSGGREAILSAALEVLRERGVANLTTREVAARAGVSEASIYYHYHDRFGLMRALFEHRLQAKLDYLDAADPSKRDRRAYLAEAAKALTGFFNDTLPVMTAAHSDPDLAAAMFEYVRANDLGPHRGIKLLGDYLRSEQAAGRVRADADVDAAALMLIETCFGLAAHKLLLGETRRLPSINRVLDEINRLLD